MQTPKEEAAHCKLRPHQAQTRPRARQTQRRSISSSRRPAPVPIRGGTGDGVTGCGSSDGPLLTVRGSALSPPTLALASSAPERADKSTHETGRIESIVAELAHELRNPLCAVRYSAALLRRPMPDAEQHKLLDRLDRQVSLSLRLVGDLLDVAHVMSGRFRLRFEEVDLTDIARESVEIMRERADQKNHRVVLTVFGDGSVVVDSTRIQQVLLNLLSNAISYTDPGGTITVTTRTSSERVDIEVRDNGRGIAPECLSHLFADPPSKPDGSEELHLGLGLRLVRRIVELHGGTVTASSAGVGHGAAFFVRLPARVAHVEAPAA